MKSLIFVSLSILIAVVLGYVVATDGLASSTNETDSTTTPLSDGQTGTAENPPVIPVPAQCPGVPALPAEAVRQTHNIASRISSNFYTLNIEIPLSPDSTTAEYDIDFDDRSDESPHHSLRIRIVSLSQAETTVNIDTVLGIRHGDVFDPVAGGQFDLSITTSGLDAAFGAHRSVKFELRRRDAMIAAIHDKAVIWTAVSRLSNGGRMTMSYPRGQPSPNITLQPERGINIYDGFMRMPNDQGDWETVSTSKGLFETKSLRRETESVNAFSLLGNGRGTISVMKLPGWQNWDNYLFGIHARGPKPSADANQEPSSLGVIFNYFDNSNYSLFRWTARTVNPLTGETLTKGRREWIIVEDGVERLISAADGGYIPGQWYNIEVRSEWGYADIRVDGHVFFSANDSALRGGGIGVWCDTPINASRADQFNIRYNSLANILDDHVAFDDLSVESLKGFSLRFNTAQSGARNYRISQGSSATADDKGRLVLNGKLVVGPAQSEHYSQTVNVHSLEPGASLTLAPYGLSFPARTAFSISSDGQAAIRYPDADGRIVTSSRRIDYDSSSPFSVRTLCDNQHFAAYVNDALALDAYVPVPVAGPARVETTGGSAQINSIVCEPIRESRALAMTNVMMPAETQYMGDWQSIHSEWRPTGELTYRDQTVHPVWHRMTFPGDVSLTMTVKGIDDPANHGLVASICKNGTKNNGYVFEAACQKTEDDRVIVSVDIKRNGQPFGEPIEPIRLNAPMSRASFRRTGTLITATIDDAVVFSAQDPEPLTGGKVAVFSWNMELPLETMRVVSPNCVDTQFSEAPWDWRASPNATVAVANRWQCDSRWTFMSLQSKSFDLVDATESPNEERVAALWSKRKITGEFIADIYVGPKMHQDRDQRYKYARDFNISFCADGKSLSSGYTFRLTGYGNRVENSEIFPPSQLLRGKTVVAERDVHLDRTIHRDWFNIRVERRFVTVEQTVDDVVMSVPASEFRIWVNDKPASENQDTGAMTSIVFTDTEPLDGSYFAIWTYDMGMIIPRVRLSSNDVLTLEHPDIDSGANLDCPFTE